MILFVDGNLGILFLEGGGLFGYLSIGEDWKEISDLVICINQEWKTVSLPYTCVDESWKVPSS